MFKRRRKRSLAERLRDVFWPRMPWRRIRVYYKHRMGRLPGTPYFIAAGFATGVAVSFTPFIGLHILLGIGICWLLRGSIIAMLIGTVIGNPWTFPFIWLLIFYTGHWILTVTHLETGLETEGMPSELSFAVLRENPLELLVPMAVGCVPYAVVSWFAGFYAVRRVVEGYRAVRAERAHAAYLRRIKS